MIGEIGVRLTDHRAAKNFFEHDEKTAGGSMRSKKGTMVVMALMMGLMAGCGTGSVTKEEGTRS
jgi:hypothetical protein